MKAQATVKTADFEGLCPVEHPGFGPHGGRQWRSPRYFACGCDAGYCENHAKGPRLGGPFFERGKPRKCKAHRKG